MRTMLKVPVEVWLPCTVDIPHYDINLAINQFIVGNNIDSYSLCQPLAQMRTIENMHFIAISYYSGYLTIMVTPQCTMVAYIIS